MTVISQGSRRWAASYGFSEREFAEASLAIALFGVNRTHDAYRC